MKSSLTTLIIYSSMVALLVGCGGQTIPTRNVVVVGASQLPSQQQLPDFSYIEHQQVMHVISLLEKAEAAYKAKRLTTPVGDNAVSYYRQVLRLKPENEEAYRGLENIVGRYLHWASSAQQKGDINNAKVYIERASRVLPKDPRIADAKRQLRSIPVVKTRTQTKTSNTTKTITKTKPGTFQLDVSQVKRQSPQVKNELALIADEIFAQQARVQIEAPSDRMGRWIYQQLNNRHEDFRVRANLKIAKRASIKLLN